MNMTTKRVRINYGINRKQGRKIVHRTCYAYLVPMTGAKEIRRMLKLVSRRHPGWLLTGWVPAKPKR